MTRRDKETVSAESPFVPFRPDRLISLGMFLERNVPLIQKSLLARDVDSQLAEIGNHIYTELHDTGFSDHEIGIVRRVILSEIRQPRMED
jgi:hypothetical protein